MRTKILALITVLVLTWPAATRAEAVWNWVPNDNPTQDFPELIGAWVGVAGGPYAQRSFDINEDGLADFSIQHNRETVSVVPLGNNQVLGFAAGPLDLNYWAMRLKEGNVVGPQTPEGTSWRNRIDSPFSYPIGGSLFHTGIFGDGMYGPFSNLRGIVGLRFQDQSGNWHYGALDVAGWGDIAFSAGILFRMGYNPVPDEPLTAAFVPMPVPFLTYLTGANEVPPNASINSGEGTLQLGVDGRTLSYHLEMSAAFDPTSAGIFGPASPRTACGQQIADLGNAVLSNRPTPVLMYDGQIILCSNEVSQLMHGQLYVNLKSARFPCGELGGQVWPAAPAFYSATLSGRNHIFCEHQAHYGEAVFTLTGHILRYQVALDTNLMWTSVGIYESPVVLPSGRNLIGGLDKFIGINIGIQVPSPYVQDAPGLPGLPGQMAYPGVLTLTDKQVSRLKMGKLYMHVLPPHSGRIGGRIIPAQ